MQEPNLNAVKGFSEFIIFGVLLVCTVTQVHEANFAEETITIDMYGTAQTTLCILYAPVALFYMGANIRDMQILKKLNSEDPTTGEKVENPMMLGNKINNPMVDMMVVADEAEE